MAVGNLTSTNESGTMEVVEPPHPNRQTMSDFRKKKVVMPLIPENQVIQGSEDVEAPGVGENEEDLLGPEEVEKETFENCLIDFPA